MLSMPRHPPHERYAAATNRLQNRIARHLERGEYRRVRELSELLQELARKGRRGRLDESESVRFSFVVGAKAAPRHWE